MKRLLQLNITENKVLSDQYFVLSVSSPELSVSCMPGHFCELKAGAPGQERKLYKPISVFDVQGEQISFMVKAVGFGTHALRDMHSGDRMQVIGPLGNAFPALQNKHIILVSGGVGYPPLSYYKKVFGDRNLITHIHGGGSCDDSFAADICYTLDGSVGEKGLVTHGLKRALADGSCDAILSCGPLPMLKAVQGIATEFDVAHYASLEAYMACGIGVCHGCSIPIGQHGYQRVCVDGPVFDASNIRWSEL